MFHQTVPKAYLEAYVKVGDWLYKKPCKRTVQKKKEPEQSRCRMCLLFWGTKGKKDVGYHCIRREEGMGRISRRRK
jgi:hypothetical protein